jgi:hypothetical protein
MPGMRQATINQILDAALRGEAISFPATWYVGLLSALASRGAAGTELSTGAGFTGYARQAVPASLDDWSGTQGDGTTAVSSGTQDYITNNVEIEFEDVLVAAWNGMVGVALYDAASAGNQWFFGEIVDSVGTPISVSRAIGEPVRFAPGALRIYLR